ncbi:MFS transporter [uncultured Vibrio sp.]|uniref:MFS transporter n=1 Tax=uncultured Vibrio sp. TaxID=114054 RepID=UPI0025DEA628|nr:MFS transporter [uncultured Vibrio sp.]
MAIRLTDIQKRLLFILCLAQFSISADIANLSIATATLVSTFSTELSAIKTLGSIQPLIGAALMLPAGLIGLFIGWRVMLIAGAIIGFVSTILFVIAPNVEFLTFLARPLTGVSSALILPAILALISGHFPGKSRALAFGILAASGGLAAAIVPLASGLLMDHVSWVLPFILISVFYFLTSIFSFLGIQSLATKRPNSFDVSGMLLSSTGIVFVVIGLINAPAWGLFKSVYNTSLPAWYTELTPISPTLVLITMGFMLLIAFYIQQRRREAAGKAGLLPVRWLRNRQCANGFLLLGLMYMILGGVSFIVITYLQVAISLSSAHSGFIILLFSICMIAFSVLTPILFKETPPKRLCLLAFIGLASASTVLMSSSCTNHIHLPFYFGMLLIGASMGMLASQCPAIITNALGESDAAQSSGLQATVRNTGVVIGICLIGGTQQWALEHSIRQHSDQSQTLFPSHFIAEVNNRPTVPYLDDVRISNIADAYGMDHRQIDTLLTLNADSRLASFQKALMVMIFLSGLGALTSTRLSRS